MSCYGQCCVCYGHCHGCYGHCYGCWLEVFVANTKQLLGCFWDTLGESSHCAEFWIREQCQQTSCGLGGMITNISKYTLPIYSVKAVGCLALYKPRSTHYTIMHECMSTCQSVCATVCLAVLRCCCVFGSIVWLLLACLMSSVVFRSCRSTRGNTYDQCQQHLLKVMHFWPLPQPSYPWLDPGSSEMGSTQHL